MSPPTPLRALPSVHEVLQTLGPAARRFPRPLLIAVIRGALDRSRAAIQSGGPVPLSLHEQVEREIFTLASPSLRLVINATGVILHTNLGRAPLGAIDLIGGYSNLEYDLDTGRRGNRDVHTGALWERLLGRPAIAVNNGAAALYLALNELAPGGEVIVSRGELIEIGDGFRIPEIMARSGAILREVGTTNRTHIEDYRNAISDRTKLILRVHPSNFKMTGFTARPNLRELIALGREAEIAVHEDLGSGCVVDLRAFGVDEPLVQESLDAGVNIVSFSGDKLLGGPQAGILAGDAGLITRMRRNPMFRALRLDKIIYQVLSETIRSLLLEEWDRVPVLRMIRFSAEEIRERAERFTQAVPHLGATVEPGQSLTGGGATPEAPLPTYVISIRADKPAELETRLRSGSTPVIARIGRGCVLLDLRTVLPEDDEELIGYARSW